MFNKARFTLISALLAAGFLAAPLHAQPPPQTSQQKTQQQTRIQQLRCGPHDKVTEVLQDRYIEKQAGHGVIRQHFIIEVFVSNEGSWTILRTDRLGTTCIMATGHSWQNIPLSPGNGV